MEMGSKRGEKTSLIHMAYVAAWRSPEVGENESDNANIENGTKYLIT